MSAISAYRVSSAAAAAAPVRALLRSKSSTRRQVRMAALRSASGPWKSRAARDSRSAIPAMSEESRLLASSWYSVCRSFQHPKTPASRSASSKAVSDCGSDASTARRVSQAAPGNCKRVSCTSALRTNKATAAGPSCPSRSMSKISTKRVQFSAAAYSVPASWPRAVAVPDHRAPVPSANRAA